MLSGKNAPRDPDGETKFGEECSHEDSEMSVKALVRWEELLSCAFSTFLVDRTRSFAHGLSTPEPPRTPLAEKPSGDE